MSQLPNLRKQLFIAMGLGVGCGGAPVPPDNSTSNAGDPQIAVHQSDPVPTASLLERGAAMTPASCIQDEYFETACGRADAGCGDTGNNMTSADTTMLTVTKDIYVQNAFAEFEYDDSATRRLQSTGGAEPYRGPSAICCYSSCTAIESLASAPEVVLTPDTFADRHCIPAPPRGTRVPHPKHQQCPNALMVEGTPRPLQSAYQSECCYSVIRPIPPEPRRNRGRAVRIDGQISTSKVTTGASWILGSQLGLSVERLAPELRRRLAKAWLRDARMEHASIASFSELSLELIAIGAPPHLLRATHQAAVDEIEHAEMTFAVASVYSGTHWGPAAFTEATKLGAKGDVIALALATFVDGCIEETVAATAARAAASRTADATIRSVQEKIAEDETRHAELAWSILAWLCRREGPTLHDALRRAVEDCRSHAPIAQDCGDCDLNVHGMLCDHEQAKVRRHVIDEVVLPCADALLAEISKTANAC